jgi:ribosomal 50S subunit-associated protein YjgA (DUF615 family)
MLSVDLRGLEKLQRDLKEAATAFSGVEIHLAYVSSDPTAVEVAMAEVDQSIDEIVARYPSNALVAQLGGQCRERLRSMVLEHAAVSRIEGRQQNMPGAGIALERLEEIRETVLELQSIDYQTMQRPLRFLVRLLKSSELSNIVASLTRSIDLDAWLNKGHATQGSVIGSAIPEWPESLEEELGVTILIVERLAEDVNFAISFSRTFYYSGSNTITSSLRKMVGGLLVPFERKFARYVRTKLSLPSSTTSPRQIMNQFTFNNSNVGAVQTGDSSVANVTVHSVQNDNGQLAAALERLSAELGKISSLPNHDKDEIVELISDARAELAKERPSQSKLKAILPMVGAAIGVVSDLGGAYTAVQLAATALGYPF